MNKIKKKRKERNGGYQNIDEICKTVMYIILQRLVACLP